MHYVKVKALMVKQSRLHFLNNDKTRPVFTPSSLLSHQDFSVCAWRNGEKKEEKKTSVLESQIQHIRPLQIVALL